MQALDYSNLLEERLAWGDRGSSKSDLRRPVYRWFLYKEGFSRELVANVLDAYGIQGLVIDPYCGAGTTPLVCKERGIPAIGFDLLPLSVFVSRVKIRNYEQEELEEFYKAIMSLKGETKELPRWVKPYFPPRVEKEVKALLPLIHGIKKEKVRDFFTLALTNAAMRCSFAYKDGSVLKIKERGIPAFRGMFKKQAEMMIKDAQGLNGAGNVDCFIGDSRELMLRDNSVSAVITSPPYLGSLHYTKIYRIESWLIGQEPKYSEDRTTEEYFLDLVKSLKEMHRALKPGGRAFIEISNVFLQNHIVEADFRTSELAEKVGFKVEKIIVLAKRFALKDRTEKVGTLRESLVVLQK